jgi:CBS domain-containing protein
LISLEEFASKEIREYIKTDYHIFKPDDSLSMILGKLDSIKHNEVIVRDNDKIGFVTVSDLLGVVQPYQTKVGDYPAGRWNVLGVVSPDYTVLDVVEILIENKMRAIPVTEKGKLKGFISQLDLLKGLAEVQELEGEPAKDVAVLPLITMSSGQSIAAARKLMRDRGFSHVPVVVDDILVGIVTAKDIVTRFITPIGATTNGDVIGEKVPRFTGVLSDIMDDDPLTVGTDASVREVVQKMLERGKSAVIQLTGNGVPIAIITPRELLSVVLRFRGRDEMPVYITGLPDIGDFMERAIIEEKIRRVMKRATKIHPHLEEVSIHIQTSRTTGNRSRYEITVNVISRATDERFSFKREGWDVINIFDDVSETLNRLLTESKHKPRGMSRTQKRMRYSLRDKPA